MIHNPILRGFHPDPSIVRVGEVYYLATSTFEWFPGVRIYQSRNLQQWELIARPLDRLSQLNLAGVPDSCGVWAPCLSHDGSEFWLVYSQVKSFDGIWKDSPNFLVTAPAIEGPWSDPIFLGGHGFDGSMFHDQDGSHWYLSMLVDHRKGSLFGGIILQEYDPDSQTLVGPVDHIFSGTELGKTEGPHLYQKDGYYYLITAEGGTDYGHAITIARSGARTGPYEVHPRNPLITASGHPDHPLQRAGHGDLVQHADGSWHVVFLTGRPFTEHRRCILGRETSIEALIWLEGQWPLSGSGTRLPRLKIPQPKGLPPAAPPPEQEEHLYSFDSLPLSTDFQSLRVPIEETWCSLSARPGYLRLRGRDSLSSFHEQSLIARRVQHAYVMVEACIEFHPDSFQQLAGLVCYYNTAHYHYLAISGHEAAATLSLQVISSRTHHVTESEPVILPKGQPLYLKANWHTDALQFFYSLDQKRWEEVGTVVDGSILSDDFVRESGDQYRPAFTGAFVGLCCQDLRYRRAYADIQWMRYRGSGEGMLS